MRARWPGVASARLHDPHTHTCSLTKNATDYYYYYCYCYYPPLTKFDCDEGDFSSLRLPHLASHRIGIIKIIIERSEACDLNWALHWTQKGRINLRNAAFAFTHVPSSSTRLNSTQQAKGLEFTILTVGRTDGWMDRCIKTRLDKIELIHLIAAATRLWMKCSLIGSKVYCYCIIMS